MIRRLILIVVAVGLAGCASEAPPAAASRDFSDAPRLPDPPRLSDAPAVPPAVQETPQTAGASADSFRRPTTIPDEEGLVHRPRGEGNEKNKVDDRERPGAENTGVKDAARLQRSGKIKATDGQVIENLFISGGIDAVNTSNVVIRNCIIDGEGKTWAVNAQRAKNLVIEHCEIYNAAAACIFGGGYTARFNEISQSKGDGLKAGQDTVIEGNWIHTLGFKTKGAHADGVQVQSAKNVKIIGNYFDMPHSVPETASNAGVFISGDKPKNRTTRDVLVQGNWFRGGNYTIQAFTDGDDPTTIRIIDNRFYQGEARYGCGRLQSGVQWTGNVFDGSGAPAPPGRSNSSISRERSERPGDAGPGAYVIRG